MGGRGRPLRNRNQSSQALVPAVKGVCRIPVLCVDIGFDLGSDSFDRYCQAVPQFDLPHIPMGDQLRPSSTAFSHGHCRKVAQFGNHASVSLQSMMLSIQLL